LRQQARWTFNKIPSTNFSYPILEDFLTKKMLAKMGYRYNPNELEEWEVEAFHLIENTFAMEEAKSMKQKRR